MERISSALSTGMFFGSPDPMKKWHLSIHAPQRTHISMKSRNERYFSSRSLKPFKTISFQLSGSFQSLSRGDHSLGLGRPKILRFLATPG